MKVRANFSGIENGKTIEKIMKQKADALRGLITG